MKRSIVTPAGLDLNTPGRRDYFVKFEHPTMWAWHLVPVTVFVGRDAAPGKGLVASGSTHGNEYEGPVALKHLMQDIRIEDVRGRIILIPTLNVAAFHAGQRDTPEDGKNLNREFPGDEKGSLTSRIAHFMSAQIFPHVHIVIDLHAGGDVARFERCVSFHEVSNAAQRKAMEETARFFGTRFMMYYQDQTPGLLPSCAERMGKIALGGEFGWGNAVSAEGVSMCRQGILTACIRHELLAGKIPENRHCAPAEQVLVDCTDLSCYLLADFEGHFEPVRACGEQVKKGELVAYLHDFDKIDTPPEPIRAPHDGFIASQAWGARVKRGQVVSIVALHRQWV